MRRQKRRTKYDQFFFFLNKQLFSFFCILTPSQHACEIFECPLMWRYFGQLLPYDMTTWQFVQTDWEYSDSPFQASSRLHKSKDDAWIFLKVEVLLTCFSIKRNSAHIYVRISSILNEIYQPVQFWAQISWITTWSTALGILGNNALRARFNWDLMLSYRKLTGSWFCTAPIAAA